VKTVKKTALFVLVFLLVAASPCPASDATFVVTVEEIREVPYFETNQTITMYDGGTKTVPHAQHPSDGSKFVLANVTVEKKGMVPRAST
jgi:hypothetical protein